MMSKNFLEEFNICLSSRDLEIIKDIINNPSDWTHSKTLISSKYKLLKVSNNEFYLVGKGKKAGVKNAFQGSGMHGTVKGAIKVTLKHNEPVLHKEKPYFVKRLRDHEGESESVIFKAEHQECFFIKVPHKNKNYIIMPKVLGTPLNKLDYKNQDQKLVKRLITRTLRKILEFHLKGYVHNDIKADNILCDISSGQLNLIDFGNSKELSKDELLNEKGFKFRSLER